MKKINISGVNIIINEQAQKPIRFIYQGDKQSVDLLKEELSNYHTMYGKNFNPDFGLPVDMYYVLSQNYSVKIPKGLYNPSIPRGAVS